MLREATMAALLVVGAGVLVAALWAFGPPGALAGFVIGPLSMVALAVVGVVARFALHSLSVQIAATLLAALLAMFVVTGAGQALGRDCVDISTFIVSWIAGLTGLAAGMCFPRRRGKNAPSHFERRE